MARYQVGKSWFFAPIGQMAYPGDVIDLSEEAAATYMHNEPGLLRPMGRTTQAEPSNVRKAENPDTLKAPETKPRRSRRTK
jgi:hypothetical protein